MAEPASTATAVTIVGVTVSTSALTAFGVPLACAKRAGLAGASHSLPFDLRTHAQQVAR